MSRIRQEVTFAAPTSRLFNAIANSEDHAAFTGLPADIGAAAGDAWSAFGGKIHGVHVDVQPGTRIVQAWRSADWADGVFSLVTFEFAAEGDGTKLTLTHDAIPEGAADMLESGWEGMYWGPLRTWLEA
jgi:uncharacterized protein YndB with AHSA1/START domain